MNNIIPRNSLPSGTKALYRRQYMLLKELRKVSLELLGYYNKRRGSNADKGRVLAHTFLWAVTGYIPEILIHANNGAVLDQLQNTHAEFNGLMRVIDELLRQAEAIEQLEAMESNSIEGENAA